MWYNRLNEEGLENNQNFPCVLIERLKSGFAFVVAIYVDDLNLAGTPEEFTKITNYLKDEFKMKDLSKQNFV